MTDNQENIEREKWMVSIENTWTIAVSGRKVSLKTHHFVCDIMINLTCRLSEYFTTEKYKRLRMDPKKDETTVDTLKRAYTAPESQPTYQRRI